MMKNMNSLEWPHPMASRSLSIAMSMRAIFNLTFLAREAAAAAAAAAAGGNADADADVARKFQERALMIILHSSLHTVWWGYLVW